MNVATIDGTLCVECGRLRMPGVDAVYVINLDRRRDKWAEFQAAYPWCLHGVTRFSAVDGANLETSLRDAPWTRGLARSLVSSIPHTTLIRCGELGCFLSHACVWKRAADAGHRVAVFEDDARFAADACEAWARVVPHLNSKSLVYLGGREEFVAAPPDAVARRVGRDAVALKPGCAAIHCDRTTHAYVISAETATRFLGAASTPGTWLPVDHFMAANWDAATLHLDPLRASSPMSYKTDIQGQRAPTVEVWRLRELVNKTGS